MRTLTGALLGAIVLAGALLAGPAAGARSAEPSPAHRSLLILSCPEGAYPPAKPGFRCLSGWREWRDCLPAVADRQGYCTQGERGIIWGYIRV
ncbi:hypothetical protein ACQEU3_38110 [Spirillospora sp. CA-253888]